MGIRNWVKSFSDKVHRKTGGGPCSYQEYDYLQDDLKRIRDQLDAQIDTNGILYDQWDAQVKAHKVLYAEHEKIKQQFAVSQNRLMKHELDATARARKSMDLQFNEIKGNAPILWINSPDVNVVNQATFANIRDRLRRLAPGIDMIILTYGEVKLWEMHDADLNKIGLVRIPNHGGGEIGGPSKTLEHKKASGQ